MFDDLDPRSPTPLYEQIASRIRTAVAVGEFAPGESLPSVRGLSRQLRVNPATVVQAYRDLEQAGFVEKRHGSGTFVKDVSAEHRSEQVGQQARDLVKRMVSEAGRLGIGAGELEAAFEQEVRARMT